MFVIMFASRLRSCRWEPRGTGLPKVPRLPNADLASQAARGIGSRNLHCCDHFTTHTIKMQKERPPVPLVALWSPSRASLCPLPVEANRIQNGAQGLARSSDAKTRNGETHGGRSSVVVALLALPSGRITTCRSVRISHVSTRRATTTASRTASSTSCGSRGAWQ